MDPSDPAYPGQAGYTPLLLAIYDPWVLGFMARVVWRCPTPLGVELYRHHLGHRHLDVGPGTGYFLAKAGLGSAEQHTPPARATLWAFNRQGSFDNLADTEDGLRRILGESFKTVEIEVVGSLARFSARAPH